MRIVQTLILIFLLRSTDKEEQSIKNIGAEVAKLFGGSLPEVMVIGQIVWLLDNKGLNLTEGRLKVTDTGRTMIKNDSHFAKICENLHKAGFSISDEGKLVDTPAE